MRDKGIGRRARPAHRSQKPSLLLEPSLLLDHDQRDNRGTGSSIVPFRKAARKSRTVVVRVS